MNGDRTGRSLPARAAARRLAAGIVLAATLAHGTASAQENGTVELWLSDAPLARVLEQIAGRDGVDVVVGEDVDRRVDGRLDGQRELVLATLAVEHGLSVHAEGNTVWFDRANRPIVSLVRLAPDEATRALAAIGPSLDDDSVVQRTDEGLVVSGTRAFVEDARRRLASLASEPATPAPDPSIAAGAAPSDTGPRREVRSVWDIPGYDVDYAAESAS